MELVIEQIKGKVVVAVVRVKGDLDGASYLKFIDATKKLYDAGARDFVIDLTETPYMSSAGLAALHSVVKLARGEGSFDPASGWDALHAIGREDGKRGHDHVKLVNPQPKVAQVLKMAGVTDFMPVFAKVEAALASF